MNYSKKTNLKWIEKNSFITVSSCITVICIILYFILQSNDNKFFNIIPLTLLFLNMCLSVLSWYQKKYSPYRIVLGVVNTAVFVVLILFYTRIIDWNNLATSFKCHLHLNTWDWIAFIIGSITLIFAACTWSSQEKTQKNTLQITTESQFVLLEDIVRDTYRNLSLIYALVYRMNGLYGHYYPSEELILRMCLDDRFIFPSLFADDYDKCCRLQRFRINVRNANIELQVIANRIKSPNTKKELLEDDIRFINERIDSNIKRLHDLLKELWKYDSNKAKDLQNYVINNAANCNDEKSEYIRLFSEADEKFSNGQLKYFYTGLNRDGERTEFMKLLFPDSTNGEDSEFLRKLNKNIYADAHLFGRIRLIPYDTSKPLILN